LSNSDIPKGNTQKSVNKTVFEILQANQILNSGGTLLDVPCGDGSFAGYVQKAFPKAQVIGVDKFCDDSKSHSKFYKLGAHEFFRTQKISNLDAITCISGVMCFDGIEELMGHFHSSLKNQGLLIVTNDNVMTIRDRLNFLFFGRFKRFKLFFAVNEGNWNLLFPQAIFMLMQRHGFTNPRVVYTAVYLEDLLFFPVAVLVYLFFVMSMAMVKTSLPLKTRLMLFPFKSLLARHYVISATKISN